MTTITITYTTACTTANYSLIEVFKGPLRQTQHDSCCIIHLT